MDPLKGTSHSTLANIMASARASLLHPTRPETPGEDPRLLLTIDESSRPNTGRSELGGSVRRSILGRAGSFTEADLSHDLHNTSLDSSAIKTSRKPRSKRNQESSPEPELRISNAPTQQRSASADHTRPTTSDLNELRKNVSQKEKPPATSGIPKAPKKTSSSNTNEKSGAKASDSLPPKPKSSSRPSSKEGADPKDGAKLSNRAQSPHTGQPKSNTNPSPVKMEAVDGEELKRILSALKDYIASGKQLSDLLAELSQLIKSFECVSPSQREQILDILNPILSSKLDTSAVLRACSVVMKISQGTEEYLSVVGDKMFGLSTEKVNDHAFFDEKISVPVISLLPRIPVLQGTKSLIFLIGVLKNISNEERNQILLVQQGAVSVLNDILLSALKDESEGALPLKDAIRIILQIAATFRNLSLISSHRKQFALFKVIQNLCISVSRYYKYEKLMTCITRVLAKLTMSVECRNAMSEKPIFIVSLFKLLEMYPKNAELVLRTAFTLGSLTAYNDDNRAAIVQEEHRIIHVFNLFQHYFEQSLSESDEKPGQNTTKDEREEALISITRLLANLAINSSAGPKISSMSHVPLLKKALDVRNIQDSEEFILNIVAVITNLSFFESPDNQILCDVETYSKLLVPLLFFDNEEAVIEAVRAYGNFSRTQRGRAVMKAIRAIDAVVILLDHANMDVLRSCCGVLMNVSSDPDYRDHIVN